VRLGAEGLGFDRALCLVGVVNGFNCESRCDNLSGGMTAYVSSCSNVFCFLTGENGFVVCLGGSTLTARDFGIKDVDGEAA